MTHSRLCLHRCFYLCQSICIVCDDEDPFMDSNYVHRSNQQLLKENKFSPKVAVDRCRAHARYIWKQSLERKRKQNKSKWLLGHTPNFAFILRYEFSLISSPIILREGNWEKIIPTPIIPTQTFAISVNILLDRQVFTQLIFSRSRTQSNYGQAVLAYVYLIKIRERETNYMNGKENDARDFQWEKRRREKWTTRRKWLRREIWKFLTE